MLFSSYESVSPTPPTPSLPKCITRKESFILTSIFVPRNWRTTARVMDQKVFVLGQASRSRPRFWVVFLLRYWKLGCGLPVILLGTQLSVVVRFSKKKKKQYTTYSTVQKHVYREPLSGVFLEKWRVAINHAFHSYPLTTSKVSGCQPCVFPGRLSMFFFFL